MTTPDNPLKQETIEASEIWRLEPKARAELAKRFEEEAEERGCEIDELTAVPPGYMEEKEKEIEAKEEELREKAERLEELRAKEEELEKKKKFLEAKKDLKEKYAGALATDTFSKEDFMKKFTLEELKAKYEELEKERALNGSPAPRSTDMNAGRQSATEATEAQEPDLDSDSEFMIEEMQEEGGVWEEIAEELMEE